MAKKTTKTQTKKTKKSTKVKSAKPTSLSIKKKPSLIEEVKEVSKHPKPQETVAVIEKIPVEMCEDMFYHIQDIFQPDGFYDENEDFFTNDRFLAMWKTFLLFAGWNENEYWELVDNMPHNEKCEQCKKEEEQEQEKLAKEKAKNVN